MNFEGSNLNDTTALYLNKYLLYILDKKRREEREKGEREREREKKREKERERGRERGTLTW